VPFLDAIRSPRIHHAPTVAACGAPTGSCNSPRGESVSVDQTRLGARDLTAWWFDPRYGRAYFAHTGVGTAIQVFTPPSSGRACDWVLAETRSTPAR